MLRKALFAVVAAMSALLMLPTPVQACDGGCGGYNGGCCNTGCYNSGNCGCCWDPCCGGPLCCGDFSVAVRGGVVPAIFTDRGDIFVTRPAATPVVAAIGSSPKFSDIFNLPWEVGAEFAWNASKRVQFFLEYSYNQATGKRHTFTAGGVTYTAGLSDYKVNSGYLGVRYYFDSLCCFSCCGPIAPFIGFKAGFAWQQRVTHDFTIAGVTAASGTHWFERQTAISGGLLVGLEWWFCKCWSLILQGEFIATQGLRGNPNVVTTSTTTTNLNIGQTGWVVNFPVTLGLRWTF